MVNRTVKTGTIYKWGILCALALTVEVSGSVLLSDDFSGTSGDALAESPLDVGGSWSGTKTDGSGEMNGEFVFTGNGSVAPLNNSPANVYTTFDAEPYAYNFTNGFTLSTVFSANGYSEMKVAFGLSEAIDKGYIANLVSGDVVRYTYFTGGSNAGKFQWRVYDEGERLNGTFSSLVSTQTVQSSDSIRLSITCYPACGAIVGEAFNLTGGYMISRSGIALNTPGLTNLHYAGVGFSGIEVNRPDDPAVLSAFTAVSENLSEARPLTTLSETQPPSMTGFPFNDIFSVTDTNYLPVLNELEPIDILHAVRPAVVDPVRAAYPEKTMITQLAWGGDYRISRDDFWPGHFLLKAGTKLVEDCPATTSNTVLYLEDYRLIAASQNAINSATDTAKYAVLHAVDENGNADWSKAEHVKMVSIDTATGALTVERGLHGTSPQAFAAGSAAIARHMMFWGNQWQMNFSLECPRGGPFNMTAAEWYALKAAQLLVIDNADGLEFDVGRWQWGYPKNNPMDCNNDLVADYGYIDGISSFGLGGQVVLRNLRELLGPDRIIQIDGNDALYGQRGWKYLNGVQMEVYPMGNDYDRFSQAFRHLRQWISDVEHPLAFSYPFSKTTSTLFGNVYDEHGDSVDWHFRVGFASALLTGMPHPFASITDINFDPDDPEGNDPELEEDKGFYKWDEYVGGELNDWKWLGPPLGPAVQHEEKLGTDDLLESVVWQWKTETGFSADCTSSNGEYTAVINALPPNTITWTSANYPGSEVPQALWFGVRLEMASGAPTLIPGQEYTVEFEAKGNDSWMVNGEVFDEVPRSMMIHGIGNYGYNEASSVFLDTEWRHYRFSMIADSDSPPPLSFGFSEQVGHASIRNMRLYQGSPERWSRDFKNGRVYLNMTLDPWTINVGTGVVQRFSGSQIPELNNGAVVNGTLVIPAQDAVYLRTGTFDAWRSVYFGGAVEDDFSIGIDGRDQGESLTGFDVQNGIGTWNNGYTDAPGSLNGNMTFAPGGGVTESSDGGGAYVTMSGLGAHYLMEVVVTPGDFSDYSFAIGFSETIDKGYFNNLSTDDVLRMRYIPSGNNAGRFQFGIFDESVPVNTTYSSRTGEETLNSNDTIRLTLSYDATSGIITGTAYNVSGDYELSTKTIMASGLTNMSNAGFGWAAIPDQTLDPAANPGIVSSFKAGGFLAIVDESISGDTADPDGDGFSNLQEYVAGTDPLDMDSGFYIEGGGFGATDSVLDWQSVSGRVYDVYWTTNLLDGFVPVETDIVWPTSSFTSPVPPEAEHEFYQLRVRRP